MMLARTGVARRERLFGLAVENMFMGLNSAGRYHGADAHHAHPCDVDRDPDLGAGVPLAALDAQGNIAPPLDV